MMRSVKKSLLVLIAGSIVTGTAITGPSIVHAVTAPTRTVTVQSFEVKNQNLKGKIQPYCSVTVKHASTPLSAPVPTPVEMCNMLSKGQELKMRGNDIIAKAKL